MDENRVTIRSLGLEDYDRGFFRVLLQLTSAPEVSREEYERRWHELEAKGDYVVLVAVKDGGIIGAASLFVERKFIRGCGLVGHIEDVAVDETQRGHGTGRKLMNALKEEAKRRKCYKVILDCKESNVAFYEKCGLHTRGVQMAEYFED